MIFFHTEQRSIETHHNICNDSLADFLTAQQFRLNSGITISYVCYPFHYLLG